MYKTYIGDSETSEDVDQLRTLRKRRDIVVSALGFLFASYIPDLDLNSQQLGNTNG